jgi:hypothetical protein
MAPITQAAIAAETAESVAEAVFERALMGGGENEEAVATRMERD